MANCGACGAVFADRRNAKSNNALCRSCADHGRKGAAGLDDETTEAVGQEARESKVKKLLFALIRLGLGILVTVCVAYGLLFVVAALADEGWHMRDLKDETLKEFLRYFMIGVLLLISTTVAFYSVRVLSKLFRFIVHHLNSLPRRVSVPLIALAIICSSGLVLVIIIQGNSSKNMERAERACVSWFRDSDFGGADAFVSDTYRKHGSIVVQIGFDRNGTSYTVVPCVYDDGKLTKPAGFDRGYWRR